MILLDKLFITQDAFATYKDLSEHMDTPLMEAAIRESQILDISEFLGPELYLLMQNDFTAPDTWATAKYQELFEGVDYTNAGKSIRMHGVQPMLSLFAYARMLDQLQLSVSRGGPVTYITEESEVTTQAQIKTKVINSRAVAIRYQQEVQEFLLAKRTDYPTFATYHIEKNKTFKIIKI